MKKFLLFWLSVLIFALMSSCAFADAKVALVSYKCLICERYYFSFDGDELDSETLNDPDIQPKRVFQLLDRGKNLEPCSSNFKAHVFERKSAASKPLSEVIKNASRIAVVKDGPYLKNMDISEWQCMAPDCKRDKIYTLNDENLMIRDWEAQTDKIFSLKGGRKIPKCQSRYTFGHAFFRSASMKHAPVKSYDIAQLAYDIYYVKN
ncbi:MAG: hypothetical protein IJ859_11330 [Synergistaceae bacterium]|nr:hypothetical protein [Synergistaceae bacterium]